ncbi:hypothetical protein CLAFUW4_04168 [Fulvia fulva]|uniref:Uncharacterized protein n=1 Tax=Passalora fulva TaxID=5499 RepID=A0A9Q8P7T1_PASFU|nr:uncharacterized protein CLAFUR5_04131 [Fulvia fulva]KAK4627298.1 hypothetical protein CLAFUR4_04154 [Fulvia fulva]KAK4628650.1 hypothetical protein CLAFUR0_04155 [Fulvia fulva]UJO16202.1 hypothetical protein CLAFUR5_04131 [Fulvia fulva]WPV13417.1 hypothetical protein CLAFUW4_04168 [Fulvia fulva]WPV29244.1 hypothetical protein CLAFUW7_04157 [Fulvia fulva]
MSTAPAPAEEHELQEIRNHDAPSDEITTARSAASQVEVTTTSARTPSPTLSGETAVANEPEAAPAPASSSGWAPLPPHAMPPPTHQTRTDTPRAARPRPTRRSWHAPMTRREKWVLATIVAVPAAVLIGTMVYVAGKALRTEKGDWGEGC